MNRTNTGANTNILQIISDVVFGALAMVLAVTAALLQGITPARPFQIVLVYSVFMMIFILSDKNRRAYNVTTFYYRDRMFKNAVKSYLAASAAVTALLYFAGETSIDRVFFLYFLVDAFALLLISNLFVRSYLLRIAGQFALRTLFVGEKSDFDKFNYFLGKTNINLNLIGYVSPHDTFDRVEYLGGLREIEQLIHTYAADQIFFMKKHLDDRDMQHYVNLCTAIGVTIRIVYLPYETDKSGCFASSIGTYPVFTYHTISLNAGGILIKRILDILGSLAGILLLSPVMLAAAAAVKLDSPGPVFFVQKRVGMNGRVFPIYKFRSMYMDAEQRKKELMKFNEMGTDLIFKIKNDPRITRVGHFLRKTSIDELPQLFNVLKGEMSLVGTRPPTLDEVNRYQRNHWRRISIKPGITGMWQVSGRNAIVDFDEIVSLDKKYIEEWSVLMDFRILLQTVVVLVMKKGAY